LRLFPRRVVFLFQALQGAALKAIKRMVKTGLAVFHSLEDSVHIFNMFFAQASAAVLIFLFEEDGSNTLFGEARGCEFSDA